MVDMLAIMLVTGACLYATIRAVMLDRMLPWFTSRTTPEHEEESAIPVHNSTPLVAAGGWRSRTAESKVRSGRPMDR
jgi:hypothetical protein